MLLLFVLSFLGKSSDFIINFTKSDYDLFLNSTGAFIRQQEGDLIVYNTTNVEDFTVHLSIDLYFDDSKDDILHIYVDPLTVNLNLDIKCLNALKDQNLYPTIFVHDKANSENKYFNYYYITIHSDTIFYYNMADWAIGTIESYSSTNQLMTRVSLSDMKSFYGAHSYICYNSTECVKNFNIGPYDSYFIAPDNTALNLYINDVYVNEYTNKFYILFDKNNDFPQMNLENTDTTVQLMGISKNPVQLKKDNTEVIIDLILSNIQLVKKDEADTSAIKFRYIQIEDETQNVFPNGSSIECDGFMEYRKNDKPSQFASVTTEEKGYIITPDFENNGDILLIIKKNVIEVLTMENKLLATVPVSSSFFELTVILINVKNINHNKIVIKNGFTDLPTDFEDTLSFSFTNCEQIPIEFVDWNDEKLSNFNIYITSDLGDIYDAIITNTNSSYLNYIYYNEALDTEFSFPYEATSAVFCLFADKCSEPELTGNNIYQQSINGEDINEINTQLNDYLTQFSQIKKLYLVLNNNLEGKELSITSDISSLTFISFIYNGDQNKLSFTLSLPESTNQNGIDMEIRKCSITANSNVQIVIKQLFSQNGQITGEKVKCDSEISEKNIDISSKDETITLSSQSVSKLIVKSGKSPHKIIFKYTNSNSEYKLYIQSDDPNYNEIPISFLEDGQSTKNSNTLEIKTVNLERIVLTSIPTSINVIVSNNDNDEDIQFHIPAKSGDFQQDKVSICYNNNHCSVKYDDSEMYFASRTETDFASIIKLLMQNDTKIYQYIRLIFQNEMEYERVNFRQIPGNQTNQIWLATCGIEDEDGESYLILNDEMENENISNWIFEPRTFYWRKNDNKPFFFKEISATINDENYSLEILDNIYENFYVDSYHIPLELTNIYDYLVNCHLIEYFNKIFIDMTQELPGNVNFYIECGHNIVKLDNENGKKLTNPDPLNLYYQIPDNNNDDQTINIFRKYGTIDQVNLVINKEIGSVKINIECSNNCAASQFELNLYLMNTSMDIKVENKNCTNVNTYYIPFTINDVPEPPEINDPEDSYTISSSTQFEFIAGGYKTKENGKDNTVTKPSSNKILFTQNSITISETENSEPSEPLYFMAYHENSKIIIKSNIINSNIGVTSDNSPRVLLEKNNNPLSFKNDIDKGGSIDIIIDGANNNLVFKEVNNNQGPFNLNVPNSVNLVSFSDITMSKTSSFEVKHKQQESSTTKKLKAANDPKIKATKSVVVSPESISTIKNLELEGTLYIHDNSKLKLNGNTKFLTGSSIDLSINLPIADSNKNNVLIECDNSLDSIPSSINISLTKNNEKVDISDLNIIGPLKTVELCKKWSEIINLENKNGYSVSNNCPEKEGKVYLTFSVKEKEDKGNKLNGGAIAGIVIGCVAAVGIIVGLTIYFIKRKKKDLPDYNEDDSMAP